MDTPSGGNPQIHALRTNPCCGQEHESLDISPSHTQSDLTPIIANDIRLNKSLAIHHNEMFLFESPKITFKHQLKMD
jgi:hypothetical protein